MPAKNIPHQCLHDSYKNCADYCIIFSTKKGNAIKCSFSRAQLGSNMVNNWNTEKRFMSNKSESRMNMEQLHVREFYHELYSTITLCVCHSQLLACKKLAL